MFVETRRITAKGNDDDEEEEELKVEGVGMVGNSFHICWVVYVGCK
jgi:hypothetical protein